MAAGDHQPKLTPANSQTSRRTRPSLENPSSRPHRRKVRRNALKHGLSVPVSKLPYFQDQIAAWFKAILEALPPEVPLTDEISAICYEIAVQQCELRRIAEMRRVLSSQPLGPSQTFSNNDVIHLMTVIEGFVIPPRTTRLPFDARAISMLYRLFGVRSCDLPEAMAEQGPNPYQIKRLASFERYENRASIRMKKAMKRLMDRLQQEGGPSHAHTKAQTL